MENYFFIGLGAIVGAMAVSSENSEHSISDREFLCWIVGMIVVSIGIGVISVKLQGDVVVNAVVVLGLCMSFVFMRKAVQRARDAGKNKGICYLICIPYVGLIPAISLMLTPRQK